MARIAGVTIPHNKKIEFGLTYIYGVGPSVAAKVLTEANIDKNTLAKDMRDEQVSLLKEILEKKYHIEGELRSDVLGNIKRLKDIGCYRGIRHAKHLPTRGQRTKTNSRTVRGNVRKTMGSGKKPSAEKT